MSLITNILRVLGADPASQDFFKGAIIVIALSADAGVRALQMRVSMAQTS